MWSGRFDTSSKREAEADLLVRKQCGQMLSARHLYVGSERRCHCFPYGKQAMYFKLIDFEEQDRKAAALRLVEEKEKPMEVKARKHAIQPKEQFTYDVAFVGLSSKEFELLRWIAGANMTIPQYISKTYPAYAYHEVATFLGKIAAALLQVKEDK